MNEQNKSEVEVEELNKRGAKLKACNDRSRARLTEVLSIAEKVLIQTVHSEGYQPGQYGQDYRDLGRAICEIRTICKKDLCRDFPDYEWMADMMTSEHFDPNRLADEIAAKASEKPIDYPTFYTPGWLCELAKRLKANGTVPSSSSPTGADTKAAKQAEYNRKHFSFCDGLFPIRISNTEDGQMASCWIGRRLFTLDLDNNERDDGGHDCAAIIRDNGKVVATIETQRGKAISFNLAYGAFLSYVRNLSGSGKHSSRGGFLKTAAKRAAATQELIKKELA